MVKHEQTKFLLVWYSCILIAFIFVGLFANIWFLFWCGCVACIIHVLIVWYVEHE